MSGSLINQSIEAGLYTEGATDTSAPYRDGDRLTSIDGTTFLQPTALWIEDHNHPLAGKEYLFPFATVLEVPQQDVSAKLGSTLVGSVVTNDKTFSRTMLNNRNINRLNIGAIATPSIDWDQPHEGNLFDFLFERRAFQSAPTT